MAAEEKIVRFDACDNCTCAYQCTVSQPHYACDTLFIFRVHFNKYYTLYLNDTCGFNLVCTLLRTLEL